MSSTDIILLCDQIDSIKLKLTDYEYKEMLDTLKRVHDSQARVEVEEEDEEEEEDYVEQEDDDFQTVPKVRTDAWYRLSLEEQAELLGMTTEYFHDWIWDDNC